VPQSDVTQTVVQITLWQVCASSGNS